MNIVQLQQGTSEWKAHRARHFNASDAPVMLGCSPYKTRTQLLNEMASGLVPEVDTATHMRFEMGHRAEALARPLAEQIVGEELFPCVGTEGRYSASFDGLTMAGDVAFEHKALNADLRAALAHGDAAELPLHYRAQMEHQLHVSGAERVLFMASQWDAEGTLIEERHCWYEPDAELRATILQGWEQFERDLAGHVPAAATVKPIGATPETLPALRIEVTGSVLATNLDAFRDHALQVIGAINTNLQTDRDFADAEATVKWCKGVEDKLDAAWEGALAQTASIDALRRTVEDVKAEFKRKRLELDKLVTAQKDTIRTEIVMTARTALCQHVADLNATLPRGVSVPVPGADFAGSIKGKRSVDAIRDTVAALLANAKAEATQTALRVRSNLDAFNLLAADRVSLFPDLGQLALKPADDFSALVQGRLAQHEAEQRAAQERAAAEAARREQAQREAQAAEQQRQAEAAAALAAQQAVQAAAQQPAPQIIPASIPKAPTDEPATLPLGKLCERLGFTVTADFLEQRGYPAVRDRSARLYREGDFAGICEAIGAHVLTLAANRRRELAAA